MAERDENRELDERIARKVMGLVHEIPAYTTDDAAAMSVMLKLRQKEVDWQIVTDPKGFDVLIVCPPKSCVKAVEVSFPIAICKAVESWLDARVEDSDGG